MRGNDRDKHNLPAITDPRQVGKKQNLSDVFYLLAVTQTPLMSTMRKVAAWISSSI